jgi:transketolase
MDAAEELEMNNISTEVVKVNTMKPFNSASVVELTKGARAVITAEEHTYIGPCKCSLFGLEKD